MMDNNPSTTTTATTICKSEKLDFVITKILAASEALPGSTPFFTDEGKPCLVCKKSIGIAPNGNGLLRTRFCNKNYAVHALVFFANAIDPKILKYGSIDKQLEHLDAIKESTYICNEISHLCDTPNCVETSHMVAESRTLNMSRKGCVGYVLYDNTCLKVCQHDPPCKRVSPIEFNIDSVLTKDQIDNLLIHGQARSKYREDFSQNLLEERKRIKEKAITSRATKASSKEEKKEKQIQKTNKKRKAKRKVLKQSKRQKL